MAGTRPELPTGLDLPPLGDVPSKSGDVLVVNLTDLVDAETANLAAAAEAASAATPPRTTAPTGTALATAPSASSSSTAALGARAESGTRRLTVGSCPIGIVGAFSLLVVAHSFLSYVPMFIVVSHPMESHRASSGRC
jgi:hypothetical protein